MAVLNEQWVNNLLLKLALDARALAILKNPDPFSRSTLLGHVTSSGLVIHNNKALLVFHPYLSQWLQPGGHIDKGESPVDAAIREVYEETGLLCSLATSNIDLVDIDIHQIPENLKKNECQHWHIDLCFLLIPEKKLTPPDPLDFEWFDFNLITNARILRAIKLTT
ncbi:NUDIX hydrolase [Polynucleobacter sp. IMCC 30228]|uniref:NUDIX hydrolase n=1 Tax=Polynucleobacter sp. IMCC 30228 TaxID=2781011 RepID=UPI001F3E964C|nr:NUDIX domain-containing protein [Polynucleobacter sp. IMCC 30228]MCE7526847.1 NUDIX domain-containing protein [Polynucleobacter sp. IMCC 30228]